MEQQTGRRAPESSRVNYEESAAARNSQKLNVETYFKVNPDYDFTAVRVSQMVGLTPIQVRKAISVLQDEGKIHFTKSVRENGRLVQKYKWVADGEIKNRRRGDFELLKLAIKSSVHSDAYEAIMAGFSDLKQKQNDGRVI